MSTWLLTAIRTRPPSLFPKLCLACASPRKAWRYDLVVEKDLKGRTSDPLRVALLALEWPVYGKHAGGVGRYVWRLAARLRTEVDLHVVCMPGAESMDGVSLHEIPQLPNGLGAVARYYLAPLEVRRVIAEIRPDVVHSHGDCWALQRPYPVIRTFHGLSAAESRWGRPARRVNMKVMAALERYSRHRSTVACGVGPDSTSGIRCEHMVPPVFRTEDSPTALTARAHERPSVAFIGGFRGRKRGWLALQAVEEARLRVPDLRFVVVGSDTEERLYPRWVEFHANPSDRQVAATLSSCWLLVAPSSYEGFGIPTWEAMSLGLAVVATPNPGSCWQGQGGAAKIVAAAQLGDAVADLLEDNAERRRLAARGRCRAEEIAAMGDPRRYLRMYHQVTSGMAERYGRTRISDSLKA